MRPLYLLLLWALAAHTALAGCLDVFRDVYTSSYVEWNCHENVIRLMKEFKKAKLPFDPKKAKVLYLFRKEGRVTGLKTRTGTRDWFFHVVLEYRGRIYDFDYTDAPKSVPRRKYFEEMLRPEEDVQVRAIPAKEYLRDFDTIVGWQYRGYFFYWKGPDVEGMYPSVPVTRYQSSR